MTSKLAAPFAVSAASALAFAGSAFAQDTSTSVSLYGNMTAAVTTLNHQAGNKTAGSSTTSVGNNEFSVSYFGLRGREDLGGGTAALFNLESGFNMDTGTNSAPQKMWNRQSWVGLDFGDYGRVTVGRQFTAGVDLVVRALDTYRVAGQSARTTPFALFSVNRYANAALNPSAPNYAGYDNRSDDLVKYRVLVPSAGLNVGASVGFDDGAGRNYSVDVSQGDKQYLIGAMWTRYQAPFMINGARPEQNTWMVGGNLNLGDVRLLLTYLDNRADGATAAAFVGKPQQENKVWQVGMRWNICPQLEWSAVVYDDKGTSLNNVVGRDGTKDTFITTLNYRLSKRSEIGVGLFNNKLRKGYALDPVNLNALAGSTTSTATSFTGMTAGMRHQF